MASKFTQLKHELLQELMLLNAANPEQDLRISHRAEPELEDLEFMLYLAPKSKPDMTIASEHFRGFYIAVLPHPNEEPVMAGMYERTDRFERCNSATIKYSTISPELCEGFYNYLRYGIVGDDFAVDD